MRFQASTWLSLDLIQCKDDSITTHPFSRRMATILDLPLLAFANKSNGLSMHSCYIAKTNKAKFPPATINPSHVSSAQCGNPSPRTLRPSTTPSLKKKEKNIVKHTLATNIVLKSESTRIKRGDEQ